MTWTKNGRKICDECGLFASWDGYDEYTPFGCSSYDPPEPHEPNHTCKKCLEKVYKSKLEYFKKGGRQGNWQKSDAEMRAAKESGLVWVHDRGFPQSKPTNERRYYQYISKEEFDAESLDLLEKK